MARYSFGPFSLDLEARVLLRDGEPIPVTGKTLDTLVVLVENRGRLVLWTTGRRELFRVA
jgi:DNA-binding winged helix-turn-helix (wHTH) protein